MDRKLYVLVSKSDTAMGRLIRTVCRYPYNHVSLSLDPEHRHWVSFARRVQDAPLYGGFIHEDAQRLLSCGAQQPVRMYEIPIDEERARHLEQIFAIAGQIDCGLLYNLFDAAASVFGFRVSIPGAYTCLSFANTVLGTDHRTIASLCDGLQEQLVYEGVLSGLMTDDGSRSDPFFRRIGPVRATWKAAVHFAALSRRAVKRRFRDPLRVD